MSDELKPCPNRSCEGSKTSMRRSTTKHRISYRRACRCGVSGPTAAWPEDADDAWNALPRDEPADAGGDEVMRLLRRIAAGDPAASNGGEYCEYCDVLANQGRINHYDDCLWLVAKRHVEAGS